MVAGGQHHFVFDLVRCIRVSRQFSIYFPGNFIPQSASEFHYDNDHLATSSNKATKNKN